MQLMVTGAAGRLGVAVTRAAEARGWSVVPLDVAPAKPDRPRVHVVDLREPAGVADHMQGCDAVVHSGNHPNMWAMRDGRRLLLENTAMNVNTFEAAVAAGVERVVFASSIQVMSGDRRFRDIDRPSIHPRLPLDHTAPAAPANPYAASKQLAEDHLAYLCRRHASVRAVALRFPWLWHAGEPGGYRYSLERVEHLIARNKNGWPDEGIASLSYGDAASLCLAAVEHAAPGFDVAAPTAEGMFEAGEGRAMAERMFPGIELPADIETRTTFFENASITERFGWEPADRPVAWAPGVISNWAW